MKQVMGLFGVVVLMLLLGLGYYGFFGERRSGKNRTAGTPVENTMPSDGQTTATAVQDGSTGEPTDPVASGLDDAASSTATDSTTAAMTTVATGTIATGTVAPVALTAAAAALVGSGWEDGGRAYELADGGVLLVDGEEKGVWRLEENEVVVDAGDGEQRLRVDGGTLVVEPEEPGDGED